MTDAAPPDEFDEQLAAALDTGRTEETVRENAALVAAYYTTLVENGVDGEHAVELTGLWLSHVISGDA